MKNETERSKDKSKLSVLKKKLTALETFEDAENKSKKDKKMKKNADVSTSKPRKSHSFVRKFSFGKYITMPSDIRRASSSKSMTESENSDRLSSGYNTLTPTSLKRQSVEEDSPILSDTACALENPFPEEGVTMKPQTDNVSRQPVSVTPYARSTWKSADNDSSQSDEQLSDQHYDRLDDTTEDLMESKTLEKESEFSEKNALSKGQTVNTEKIKDEPAETDGKKRDSIQEVGSTESATEAMPAFGNLVMDVWRDRPEISSNISQSGLERKEHLYKILVIGELGTGKTSIIKRYVHQFFSQHYRATIGVDFALKVLNWDANTIIRLQLWDIAGQERFGNMTRVYYKDAVGAFIVFDVTRVATFDAVDKWKQDLDSKVQLPDGSSIPCVLLGNKCDQQKEGIVNTPARMDEYCKERGFSGWFETSAKENINIEEAARFLVNKILLNDKLLHSSEMNKDNDRIAIDEKGNMNGHHLNSTSKTCSC